MHFLRLSIRSNAAVKLGQLLKQCGCTDEKSFCCFVICPVSTGVVQGSNPVLCSHALHRVSLIRGYQHQPMPLGHT